MTPRPYFDAVRPEMKGTPMADIDPRVLAQLASRRRFMGGGAAAAGGDEDGHEGDQRAVSGHGRSLGWRDEALLWLLGTNDAA